MSRKHLIIGAAFLCAIAALNLWFGWGVIHDPIRPGTCARIQTGMTEQEVDDILGGPSPNIFPAPLLHTSVQPVPGAKPILQKIWLGEVWLVEVLFDGQGRVCGKEHFQRNLDNPGPRTLSGVLRQAWGW